MSNEPKLNNLAVDFQPDAVEIAMRPLPFGAKLGVWIGIIFFFGALISSYFCEVDVIVNGTGKLVSVEPNIVMKPLDRTVIKSVDVKVGEVVREGQVLMTFDPELNQADEERLESDYQAYKAQFDRWSAEFAGKEYLVSGNPNSSEERQLALFRQRRKYYDEKLRYFRESIERVRVNVQASREVVVKQRERMKVMQQVVIMHEDLLKSKAGTLLDLLEYRMALTQLEAEIAQLDKSIEEGLHQVRSLEAERESFVMEWQKEISENLVAAEQTLTATSKSLDKIRQLTKYDKIVAPCDAIVHEIASFPVGSAVREAEALITLVPINCPIELEAEIPAKDIGRVKVGDSVRVKLTAFPFQKHGTLEGKIRTISEDTFQRETRSQELESPTYYRARIILSGKLRNVHNRFRMIPGMEAQAEIKIGTRSVLEYIVHPLIKSLDEAIREP